LQSRNVAFATGYGYGVSMTPNVALSRALQRVGCSSRLGGSLTVISPSREDQHGGMAH
jgi:ribosomal protein S12 methylthiotransferase accessory factor YcaO